jgi:hypothetical protein
LDTVGEQPPPAGVTGAERMAASDATVATARPAAAPIRSPLVLIFPLNTGRMEIPFVGFPETGTDSPRGIVNAHLQVTPAFPERRSDLFPLCDSMVIWQAGQVRYCLPKHV